MAKAKINKYNSIFATKLRELIEERNTTIKDVAEHLGFSRQAVSQYYNGDTQPNVDAILKIAEYFNVSCDYLLRGVSSENLSISEEIGLSEKSIEILKALKCFDDIKAEYDKTVYNNGIKTERFMSSFNAFIEAFERSAIVKSFIEASVTSDEIKDFDIDDPSTYDIISTTIEEKYKLVQSCALGKAVLEAQGCCLLSPREAHEYKKERIARSIADFVEAALFHKTKNDYDNLKYWPILNNLRLASGECSVFEYVTARVSAIKSDIEKFNTVATVRREVNYADNNETE